jgi:hypothetical protein
MTPSLPSISFLYFPEKGIMLIASELPAGLLSGSSAVAPSAAGAASEGTNGTAAEVCPPLPAPLPRPRPLPAAGEE